MEVKTPVFSREGLALCDLPPPTDVMYPVDYWSARPSIAEVISKEVPSPKQRPNTPPTGNSARPPSPWERPVHSISSKHTHQHTVVLPQVIDSPGEAKEPSCSRPQLSPRPKRKREPRPISWMLRPTSSSGPAPQMLSPPPVKVSLAVRRGATLPSRLPPAPPPRKRSHQSIKQSQVTCESPHKVSEPGTPTSITLEEGLIQLQVRTQQGDCNTPLKYTRSFRHVRELNSRTLPTHSLPLPISITATPLNARPDSPDDAGILRSGYVESPIELISSGSSSDSGEADPVTTPPDDAITGITITRSRRRSSATSHGPHSSGRARVDEYASSFLDFEPGTPLSPAPQSPFTLAQSHLFISVGHRPCESIGGSAQQSHADASANGSPYEERRGYGARRLAVSIPSPSTINGMRGAKTRPSPLSPATLYTDTSSNAYTHDTEMGCGRISEFYSTGAVRQSLRRPRSGGARRRYGSRPRSRGGNGVTRRSGNSATNRTSVASRPGSSSRMKDTGKSASPRATRRWPNYQCFT
jgi:hypothetical protein